MRTGGGLVVVDICVRCSLAACPHLRHHPGAEVRRDGLLTSSRMPALIACAVWVKEEGVFITCMETSVTARNLFCGTNTGRWVVRDGVTRRPRCYHCHRSCKLRLTNQRLTDDEVTHGILSSRSRTQHFDHPLTHIEKKYEAKT